MNHINFTITANTYFDFIIKKFFEISVFSTFNLSYIKKYITHGPKSLHFGPSGRKAGQCNENIRESNLNNGKCTIL